MLVTCNMGRSARTVETQALERLGAYRLSRCWRVVRLSRFGGRQFRFASPRSRAYSLMTLLFG
eukprot:237082-Amphidinium_carterae.1